MTLGRKGKEGIAREVIRAGHLPKQSGEIFRSLQARPVDSDYGACLEITPGEAEDSVEQARRFMAEIDKAIRGMLQDR